MRRGQSARRAAALDVVDCPSDRQIVQQVRSNHIAGPCPVVLLPAAAPLLCRCGSVCSLGLGGRKIIGWGCLSRAVVGSVRVHAGVMHCCGRRRGIQVESPGHASLASASAERATAVSTSGRSRAPVLHFERRVCYVYRASYMRPTLCSRGHPLLCSPWYIHVGGGFLSFLSPSDVD